MFTLGWFIISVYICLHDSILAFELLLLLVMANAGTLKVKRHGGEIDGEDNLKDTSATSSGDDVDEDDDNGTNVDIWSYIKSKQLKSRTNEGVVSTKRTKDKGNETVTKFSAKRESGVEKGDIQEMQFILVRNKTSDEVSLTGLQINVMHTSPDITKRNICELQNGTYMCTAHASKWERVQLMKLDCFLSPLAAYRLPHVERLNHIVCKIDATTVAVTFNDMVNVFSVKKNIKLVSSFELPELCGCVTCIDGFLYIGCCNSMLMYTLTGRRLKTVSLPFPIDGHSSVTSDELIYSYTWRFNSIYVNVTDIQKTLHIRQSIGFDGRNRNRPLNSVLFCNDTNDNVFCAIVNEASLLISKLVPSRYSGNILIEFYKRITLTPGMYFFLGSRHMFYERSSDMLVLPFITNGGGLMYIDVSNM